MRTLTLDNETAALLEQLGRPPAPKHRRFFAMLWKAIWKILKIRQLGEWERVEYAETMAIYETTS